ncbi:MAG: hypothetical protein A4E47_00643 [Methanosaeta sp. PtaU1.Bin028]|nr:MAG: hypothetical protein A4E47_00643 [Methanosaeta sp. PtaU1.Bin028]
MARATSLKTQKPAARVGKAWCRPPARLNVLQSASIILLAASMLPPAIMLDASKMPGNTGVSSLPRPNARSGSSRLTASIYSRV